MLQIPHPQPLRLSLKMKQTKETMGMMATAMATVMETAVTAVTAVMAVMGEMVAMVGATEEAAVMVAGVVAAVKSAVAT